MSSKRRPKRKSPPPPFVPADLPEDIAQNSVSLLHFLNSRSFPFIQVRAVVSSLIFETFRQFFNSHEKRQEEGVQYPPYLLLSRGFPSFKERPFRARATSLFFLASHRVLVQPGILPFFPPAADAGRVPCCRGRAMSPFDYL